MNCWIWILLLCCCSGNGGCGNNGISTASDCGCARENPCRQKLSDECQPPCGSAAGAGCRETVPPCEGPRPMPCEGARPAPPRVQRPPYEDCGCN